uniref:Phospholipase A2 domain-containing protein n=1 Tax=Attheya septentrionalis TaxID=420275 RepID=A0A7S2UGL8_9STRA|mmetsp:Transcript_24544/g.44394  ORF Transcript_24544/g.44394 Transcript_24544/m.44394 type:complete len:214 (+) Transcript_24544:194-835(+)
MMIYSIHLFTVLVAASVRVAYSKTCEEQCESLPGAMAQFGQTDMSFQNALSTYKYGQYCGTNNFASNKIFRPNPCNPVDEACFHHEMCYLQNGIQTSSAVMPSMKRMECTKEFIERIRSGLGQGCELANDDDLCEKTSPCPYEENAEHLLCLFCGIFFTDAIALQKIGHFPSAFSICTGGGTALSRDKSGYLLASVAQTLAGLPTSTACEVQI